MNQGLFLSLQSLNDSVHLPMCETFGCECVRVAHLISKKIKEMYMYLYLFSA